MSIEVPETFRLREPLEFVSIQYTGDNFEEIKAFLKEHDLGKTYRDFDDIELNDDGSFEVENGIWHSDEDESEKIDVNKGDYVIVPVIKNNNFASFLLNEYVFSISEEGFKDNFSKNT